MLVLRHKEDTFVELTETLRAEKNVLVGKLEKMRNVKGESLTSRMGNVLKS